MGDTVRYDIAYRCRFGYAEQAAESQNELRACPSTDDVQTVLHARVQVTPSARVHTFTDYWGTRVDSFGVRAAHDRLEVLVEATVEVGDPPAAAQDVPLAALQEQAFRDAHLELLPHSPMAEPDDAVVELAAATAPDATHVVALAEALAAAVEVTEVGTPVGEVLRAGSGVCQDRAHLLVALCRERGVPARYVSGYLCDGPSGSDTTTHAWVEVAVPGQGWHTVDPSDREVTVQHRAVIGRGRDYGDVAPLRGTYVGGDDRELDVAVELHRVTPVGRD